MATEHSDRPPTPSWPQTPSGQESGHRAPGAPGGPRPGPQPQGPYGGGHPSAPHSSGPAPQPFSAPVAGDAGTRQGEAERGRGPHPEGRPGPRPQQPPPGRPPQGPPQQHGGPHQQGRPQPGPHQQHGPQPPGPRPQGGPQPHQGPPPQGRPPQGQGPGGPHGQPHGRPPEQQGHGGPQGRPQGGPQGQAPGGPQGGPQGPQPQGHPQGPAQGRPQQGPGGPQGGPQGNAPDDDPYRPFVTAGQISGPKTPPPERQQELWNTVFGENYQALGDEEELAKEGRPFWLYAFAGTVAVALVGVIVWAFVGGPLSGGDEEAAAAQSTPSANATASTKPAPTRTRLPRYTGQASPVNGTITDPTAGISVPRLGGLWREDPRGERIRTAYGYTTRQYVAAGKDPTGKPQYAQLMTGPLPERLTSKYTSPDKLTPVVSAVAYHARLKFFPKGNTVVKTVQQKLTIGGRNGQLMAYQVTAGESKTTMVVAAIDTGRKVPSIVYMSVPDTRRELRPDINTVFSSVRITGS